MVMYAVMKGKRMVEPAFQTEAMARDVCAAYGIGYRVAVVVIEESE